MNDDDADAVVLTPAELSGLGEELAEYPPPRKPGEIDLFRSAKKLFGAGICALLGTWLAWAVVDTLFIHPNPKKDPPREFLAGVAFVSVCFFGLAGLIVTWGPSRPTRYVFYRDALAVLRPKYPPRVIPWGTVGELKRAQGLQQKDVFEVEGGDNLEFTGSLFNSYEKFLEAIRRCATRARLLRELGGERAVAALATGRPADYFRVQLDLGKSAMTASIHDEWTVFRVSPVAGGLLFVRVGAGLTKMPNQPNVGGGLAVSMGDPLLGGVVGGVIGGLAARKQAGIVAEYETNMRELMAMDPRELAEAAMERPGSFLVPREACLALRTESVKGGMFSDRSLPRLVVPAPPAERKFSFVDTNDAADAIRVIREHFGLQLLIWSK